MLSSPTIDRSTIRSRRRWLDIVLVNSRQNGSLMFASNRAKGDRKSRQNGRSRVEVSPSLLVFPTGCATSLVLRSRMGLRASLMALTFASGSRAVAPSTASDAVHNAVDGAFMTLPAYSRSREGEGH